MSYFIVTNNELPDVVNPEIPKWYSDRDHATKRRAINEKWWGDMKTKRILLADSIDDALQVAFLRGDLNTRECFVYQAFMLQSNLLHKPTKEEEPLVQKVGVYWYTSRIRVKLVGKIERIIVDDRNKDFVLLRPAKPGEKDSPKLYIAKYKWNWLQKSET